MVTAKFLTFTEFSVAAKIIVVNKFPESVAKSKYLLTLLSFLLYTVLRISTF